MINTDDKQHRSVLQRIARRAMMEKGLLPDFSTQAIAELDGIQVPAIKIEGSTRDLRTLVWCSIDNDDSLDLDQLSVAIPLPEGVKMIHLKLLALLEKEGVRPIESIGEKFDPEIHHAVAVVKRDGVEQGTIIEDLRRGYFWKKKLLRPAQVRIAG